MDRTPLGARPSNSELLDKIDTISEDIITLVDSVEV